MTSTNAVIYCRISRDRAGAGLGIERQTADCRALAERLGWTVLRVESDNDISAYSGKRRPGYERALAALESGEASAVVAWHADRLHRRNVELERFLDVIEQSGAEVATVQSGPVDLASPSGRMSARILAAVASHEVEHATQRIRAEKAQALAAGRFRGGLRPFGYERDGLTLRPVEADLIRQAITDVTTGKPLRAVAREWTQAGHLTTLGKAWTAPSMKVTLTRWRNAGLVELNGEPAGAAQWEAIVTEDEVRAVRAVLADPARRTSRGNQRKFQGSGIYIDAATGNPMKATMSNRVEPQPIYRADPRGPGSATADADDLDEYVSAAVCARLSEPDARELLATPGIDTRALSAQRAGLASRLDELAGLFADGAITGAQLARASADLRTQLDAVDAQLAAATEHSELGPLLVAEDIRAAWDGPNGLDVDPRARIIKSLARITISPMTTKGVRRTFKPEAVEIEWL